MANNVNEKVRIPKEVAEAIEYYRSNVDGNGWENDKILRWFINYKTSCARSIADLTLATFAAENLELLVKALYIGYEIEQPPKKITLELTPEELGTLACAMGATSDSDVRESAEFNRVKIVDEQYPLYVRLKTLALEEARA